MNFDDTSTFSIEKSEAGKRLDKTLVEKFPFVKSRTYFHFLFASEAILVNDIPVKKSYLPAYQDEVEVQFLAIPEISLEPENIPLDILFEDEEILVINKPSGLVVHPAPGHYSGTLVNALLHYFKSNFLFDKKDLRPGIVHRLDKDTSGVLAIAKTPKMHCLLVEAFSQRKVYKEYEAITVGVPPNKEANLPIGRHPKNRQKMSVREGGKEALSIFETLGFKNGLAYVKVIIKTGRTHQIRVHLEHLKAPILGDPLYGSLSWNEKKKVKRPLLHARRLCFNHPTKKTLLDFEAPLPEDFFYWTTQILP